LGITKSKRLKMKNIVLIVFIIILFSCGSKEKVQNDTSSVESLVNTEKAFAQRSRDTSTKAAFQEFLADDGILFKPEVVNGKEFWKSNEDMGELLFWQPEYAAVSSAGDLGFTIGPFFLQPDRQKDSVAFAGHYASVWRNVSGHWRLMVDLGIGHASVSLPDKTTTEIYTHVPGSTAVSAADQEKKFLSAFQNKGLSAYREFMSDSIIFLRSRNFPLKTPEQHATLLNETDKGFIYAFMNGATSASGDMAYTYGAVEVELKNKEGRKVPMHYLRIWRNEGNSWKIALDIIGG
jgi:ketosteroid isomerase-like protein